MKKLMKNKKFLILPIALVVLIVGTTLAYFNQTLSIQNKMGVQGSRVEFVEKFKSREDWLPGERIEKTPYFHNNGGKALLLRVKPNESWNGVPVTGESVVEKTDYKLPSEQWIEIGEYFYYTKVLPAGGKTDSILTAIKLLPKAGNDGHDTNYSGAAYVLDFAAEAVDAVNGAILGDAAATISGDTVSWEER